MHSSLLAPAWRRAAAGLLAVALAATAVPVARAADTELADPSGVLHVDAPGRWRKQEGPYAIAANGFLGGIKRAELFGALYDDLKTADAAARRWKEERTKEGGEPTFTHSGDPTRWVAHSASSGTVDYVRALDGAGKAAVVWVRLSGAPGGADDDAKALLDAARLAPPEAEKPAGGAAPGGEAGGAAPTGAATGVEHKDPDFRISVRVPAAMVVRKDVPTTGARVVSLSGPVGSDTEAFLDLYLFDDFSRADACGKWWQEKERMGWRQGVRIEGDVTAFKAEVRDEVWTRHVRIVPTDAGVVAVKLDVASQAEKAALELIDSVLGSLQVLKARPAVPTPPPGMRSVESEKSIVQHELPDDSAALKDLQLQADVVEDHVTAISGLPAPANKRAVLRVYADAQALANALRPLGVDDGRAAYWWVREGAVLTHGGALESDDTKAALRLELTRAALQRRLGFRAPYWIEQGIGNMVASAVYNKGRVDQPHPLLTRAVADAAPTGVELQTVRWWNAEDSAGHPERAAIAWSYVHFFLHGGAAGRKWEESWRSYMALLQSTGDPVEAGHAFDFARETELAADWQLWARKL